MNTHYVLLTQWMHNRGGLMKLALLAFYSVLIMATAAMADTEITTAKDMVVLDKWKDGTKLHFNVPNGISSTTAFKTRLQTDGTTEYYKGNVNYELRVYSLVLKNRFGTEYEIVLKKKPPVNYISIPVNLTGLVAYYQPPLDEEMNDPTCTPTDCQDAHRPEIVVGSYAVYHATKKDYQIGQTNYMAGKAFHIYRPQMVDALGNKEWCAFNKDLNTTGMLTITCSQSFLDMAVYPIKI